MSNQISVSINVHSDDDYHYTAVAADDQFAVAYREDGVATISISFASLEEMESVANAMLLAAKTFKSK